MNYKTIFKSLAKALEKNGININYQVNWSSSSSGNIVFSDQPSLGNGNYNGKEGWYFSKSDNIDFTNKEKKAIKETLLSKGFKCKSITDFETDINDDRTWRPKFGFIEFKKS